jgi:hypothetical protein
VVSMCATRENVLGTAAKMHALRKKRLKTTRNRVCCAHGQHRAQQRS